MSENNTYCKCNTCNSVFEQALLETPCPFCGDTLSHKEIANVSNYFNSGLPKLNDPKDFTRPSSSWFNSVRFLKNNTENYLTRDLTKKYHILSVVPIFKFFNNKNTLIKLCIVWDNNFKNKAYGIYQDVTDITNYKIDIASFDNMLYESENKYIHIYNKLVPDECYEKFLRDFEEINSLFNISDLFTLYHTINWDLLDDQNEQKTYYEYASVNYLLHLFELIKVPNIDVYDYETRLLSFNMIATDMNFINPVESANNRMTPKEFLEKYVNNNKPLMESVELTNYEDIFDYFSTCLEGAVAPNAVGLSSAAQRSSAVFNKLYDLGYNPKMQVYSLGEKTSLCPTFEKDNKTYYLECNNNIMMGINEFESIDDMRDILNEVYNEYNEDNLFYTVEGLTSDVLTFILNNSKTNKDFLTSLINLNTNKDNGYRYTNTVQDEEDFKNSVLAQFTILEMTPQNLFKYGKTHYRLRNYQKLAGDEHGLLFIDKNNNVAGYVIVKDKIYNMDDDSNKRTIPTFIAIEASSEYKADNLMKEMLDYYVKKFDLKDYRIESRNFELTDQLKALNNFKIIANPSFTLFETINESSNIILNESINSAKRKQIEEKIYKTLSLLDKTGANTQKYKKLFSSMNDDKFDKYMKEFLKDDKKNFYLEILPNKNCPRIKDCKDALDFLKVPTEEYVYYKQDGHKDDPIRTRYKVPVLYVDIRRLQQMLSKKNTYSLDISKRNMKTGQVTADDKIARISDMETFSLLTYKDDNVALKEFLGPRAKILVLNFFNCWKLLRAF